MPVSRRVLSTVDVRCFVDEHCFPTGSGGGVGAELEWLAVDATDTSRRARLERIDRALVGLALPGGSVVSIEPGGQVELSSAPTRDYGRCTSALSHDLHLVSAALADVGVSLVGSGIDAYNFPVRLLDSPRYAAMEAFFDACGEQSSQAGRTMMCNTAAIQVNVDATRHEADRETRWHLAHAVGPVLAGAFANSPVSLGRSTGWRSARLAAWQRIDRTRTAPARRGRGCVDDWANYALDARVMMIPGRTKAPDAERTFVAVTGDLTFRRWLEDGHWLGWPTIEDFEYHLTTLFPPVRPKGWLELRILDALPEPWWRVAVAVATALLDDPEAAAGAGIAAAPAADRWTQAARWGLADPGVAAAARACFQLALPALERLGVDPTTIASAHEYTDRYVARSRCLADEAMIMGVSA